MTTTVEKKVRALTPKSVMHKATTAKSAIGFLDQYREFLTTGELVDVTGPIVVAIDKGEKMPTPGVVEIANALLAHVIAVETAPPVPAAKARAASKMWLAAVYDSNGRLATRVKPNGDIEDLSQDFDNNAAALRWLDKRLYDGSPGWHGEIIHAQSGRVEKIIREDAISRTLHKGRGPVCFQKSTAGSSLSFKPKVHQTRVTFSRG